MKFSKYAMSLVMAATLPVALSANAAETAVVPNPFVNVLAGATSAEMPGKAAELVTQAGAKNFQQTTVDVTKAALGLNPAAAPVIVGSIAKASALAAATAAATAVTLVPNQVGAIARAAAAAAPAQAGAIVEAICRALPGDYEIVADAVASVVPGAGKEILAGIAAAIPELKANINRTLATYNGNIPSVSAVLARVVALDTTVALASGTVSGIPAGLPQGPSVSAPIVPLSGTPIILDPGAGGQIPTGGPRGYAAP